MIQKLIATLFSGMNSRNVILSLCFILIVLLVFVCRRSSEPVRKEALDRQPRETSFSKRALCNMKCFGISQADAEGILEKGIILFHRSQRNKRPCPVYTIQGQGESGKTIQVILEQCADQTKFIDCFLLTEKTPCQCDEK
jgi:hypothetical protein